MEKQPNFGSLALKDLHCPYCGALNAEDEPRCHRCGQRLQTPPDASGGTKGGDPVFPRRPRQTSFFDDRPKIIPIQSPDRARPIGRPRKPRTGSPQNQQQSALDLRAPGAGSRRTVIHDAPVAEPKLRLQAAGLDLVFIGVGVVLAGCVVHFWSGAEFALSGGTALFYLGAVLSMALFYELFWCVLGRESAGMRRLGLRVLTFDGQRPETRLYVLRFFLTCFSVAAAGLGLIWGLIDEETLTWQDHISKTFPTRKK